MDLKGYDSIGTALENFGIKAEITPMPDEAENVTYLTIETDKYVVPADVLNALGTAGLIYLDGPSDAAYRTGPILQPLGVQRGCLTFQDMNLRRSR